MRRIAFPAVVTDPLLVRSHPPVAGTSRQTIVRRSAPNASRQAPYGGASAAAFHRTSLFTHARPTQSPASDIVDTKNKATLAETHGRFKDELRPAVVLVRN